MAEFKYEKLAEQHKNTVVVLLRGGFYHAFNESAFVLNVLTGYKVKESSKDTYKVGFPIEALDKVSRLCEENRVNFIAYDKNVEVSKHSFDSNRFLEFCTSFDKSLIEMKEEKGVETKTKDVEVETKESKKQIVSYIQGQGLDLGNAIMNLERNLQSIIDKGKEITCFSFVEDKNAGQGEISQVQGIVIYK